LTIVHCLADKAGETVGHAKLAAAMKTGNSARALAQHIAGVRRKFLDVDPGFNQIEADPGTGYRWKTGV
jgi:DNA-binding winged helix-turn-helix (wHTH) protein